MQGGFTFTKLMTNQVKQSLPLQDILTFSWCASSLESRQLYSEGNLRNKGKTKNQFLDNNNNNNLTSDQNMILTGETIKHSVLKHSLVSLS